MKSKFKEKIPFYYGVLAFFFLVGLLLIFFSFISEKKEDEVTCTKKEQEIAAFLEESSYIDKATVKLFIDENGAVSGAAVICDKGENPLVKSKIIGLLSASLGLKTKDIYVSSSD